MKLEEKLKNLRLEKGITQEQLAKSIYVSRTLITKFENGDAVPTDDCLMRLGDYFGVDLTSYRHKDMEKLNKHCIANLISLCSIILFILIISLPFFKNGASILSALASEAKQAIFVTPLIFMVLTWILNLIFILVKKVQSNVPFIVINYNFMAVSLILFIYVLINGIFEVVRIV